MKKLLIGLMAMLTLPMAIAADFKEGTHYDVIKQTATAKPEVIEFFSYYCPHCFKFEPVAESIKKLPTRRRSVQKEPRKLYWRPNG
ncbi:periplasmic thiol:disulfide interchange protein DsbA [Agarivorans albus MKT 106]|uniref:Periplasmic thiol:disulfide interchange protein DsbA n=1 Tax=Agarivorans albus MKT 106 TaxID=1331007 RepID=R9PGE9_AGAAL|nr:periplasmic thiol:disulfide interchange protein DsbA [Agarivorans albus MKT 106]